MAEERHERPGLTYKDAGVDIPLKNELLRRLKEKVHSTFIPGVLHEHGAFGGIFSLEAAGLGQGVLVASTDGVGTKVRLARLTGVYHTVGQDLVNHSVNDILVQGARPLFFLDYIGTGRLEPQVLVGLVDGIVLACQENGMALLGGETAEMPGVYGEGDFDLVGTIVGLVEGGRPLSGREVRPGDVLLALPSTGLHTNGYSLAQKVLFGVAGLAPGDTAPGLAQTVGEALMAVHRSYLGPVYPLLRKFNLRALAHITGGGLPDNLPRVLPPRCRARVETWAVPRAPIFDLIGELGRISWEERFHVFNMGFGFILVAAPEEAEAVAADLEARGEEVFRCGQIVEGERGVELLR